jgi:hypothetical protein
MGTTEGATGTAALHSGAALDGDRFDRLAGTCSIVLGVGGVAHSAAFVAYLQSDARPALFLASLLLAGSGSFRPWS